MAKKTFLFPEAEIGGNFSSGISTHVDWEPRTNIIEAGNLMLVEIELPGVNKDDVSIQLQDESHLIIRGTKHQPRLNTEPEEKTTYYLFEREFGSFYKRIAIDFPLDSSKIESQMENGVLTVEIPKKKTGKISVDIK
ncbi:MAG: Hsp20/alpha crystallin family protein [bacterium]|nr:Hsp20/alpha crystallin family protein [bacterium]